MNMTSIDIFVKKYQKPKTHTFKYLYHNILCYKKRTW